MTGSGVARIRQEPLGLLGLVHGQQGLGRAELGVDDHLGLAGGVHWRSRLDVRAQNGLKPGIGVLVRAREQDQSSCAECRLCIAGVELECLFVHLSGCSHTAPVLVDLCDERQRCRFVARRHRQRGVADRRETCGHLQRLVGLIEITFGDQPLCDSNTRTCVVRAECECGLGRLDRLVRVSEETVAASQTPVGARAVVFSHGALESIDRRLPLAVAQGDFTSNQVYIRVGRVFLGGELDFGLRGGRVGIAERIGGQSDVHPRRFVSSPLQMQAQGIGDGCAFGILAVADLIVRFVQQASRDERAIQARVLARRPEHVQRTLRIGKGIGRRDELALFDRLSHLDRIP